MKALIRILHIAWLKAKYGGAHKYLDRLVQRLLARQFRVTLVVNQQDLERPFLQELSQRGVDVIYLPIEDLPQKSAIQLEQIIGRLCPDLVHFNSGAKQIRKMVRCMSSWDSFKFHSVFTMHLPLIRTKPNRSDRFRAALPFTHAHQRMAGKIDFAKRFDRIISVSKNFARVNMRGLNLAPNQVMSIPNGVDINRFSPPSDSQYKTDADPIVIGGCGGLVPQKRFDLLIDAIAKLKGNSLRVRIAGEGEERERLQQMIDRHHLTSTVTLVGHQSDVPAFLRDLDIFVMPSDYEAFPYSQLEAMATGLPSVVTAVGDLPLIVRDGKEGWVVPVGNVSALTAALRALIANKTLRRKMGELARDRVVQNYEQHECESRTLDLFESLLN